MKRWVRTWLAFAAFPPGAYAAEPNLAVELPDVALVLPRVSPPHFQQEGLPYASENVLVTELLAFLDREDFRALLNRARVDFAEELALLEAGDPAGVVGASAGPGRLPIPVTAGEDVSATVLYLVGVAYLSLREFVPAEAALKAALVPLPDYLRVHEALGILYVLTERYGDARVHLTRAAELGLNTADLHASLGFVNHQAENWWGAASAYQQALAIKHDERNWQTGLLHALNETRQYSAGLALVEQMLQAEPDDADLWLYRAHMSLNAEQRVSALTSLEIAIRLGDDSLANKQVAAALHMESGSAARAVELLKSASAEDLDFQFIHQALAWLDYEDEWDYFRDLLAAAERRRSSLDAAQRSQLLTHRSTLQQHDGDRRAAIASLQEALQLDASNADKLMRLGQAYRDERDYNRAELMFQRASAFPLHRENALVSLAQLAIDQQSFERALTLLRDVVSRNPVRTDLRRTVDQLESLVLAEGGD